jgi:hypothetical protein
MNLRRIAISAALSFAVVACGPSSGDDPHDDSQALLTIDPPTSELLIENGTPATASFTATLRGQ